jgi:type IV pilus assembly protein PilV
MSGFYNERTWNARITGFSLLEVLISIVIVSVGLLGLASMQATGLRNNHSAYQSSQATVLAYDLADRMRANMDSVNHYLTSFTSDVVTTPVTLNGVLVEVPVEVDLSGCTSTSGCSSADLAQRDLLEWNGALATALPGAVGTVTLTGDIYTIGVSWDDNRDGAVNGSDPNFQVSFQL